MNPIDWRSTILRWSAVAFTLGAWAGICPRGAQIARMSFPIG
jgi:hypothetical protein